MQERIIQLNGHDTRLLDTGGDGPTLLFLHGFPEHAGGWAPVMRQMGGFRCLAPDQRGYGTSWRPPRVEDYKAPLLVGDMLDLIETLGLTRVHVVGHDWGAAVAYGIAFVNDPRVATLTIVNGVHPIPFQRELAKGSAQAEASQYMLWLRKPESHGILAANDFENLLGFMGRHMDGSWLTDEVKAEYKRVWRDEKTIEAMVNWYRATPIQIPAPGHPIPPERLPAPPANAMRVKVPHLLIWGMGDVALLPGSRANLWQLCDAGLEVHEIDGTDHWINHQKPQEVARLIGDFVSRNS